MVEDKKEESKIKVTDKRMFTADGDLREDFRHLESPAGEDTPSKPPPAAARAGRAEPWPAEPSSQPPGEAEPPRPAAASEPAETAGAADGSRQPSFLELVAVLADPVAIYLGDMKLPDGSSAENLDAARYYIDLLDVLEAKTAGNLTQQEAAMLRDLLYQLRMRYVRKTG